MLHLFDRNDFSKIAKYFPAYLVFLGALKLIIFYHSFDIRIVEYLDFSEVLISFFDTFIFYVSIFVLPFLLFTSFWGKSIAESNAKDYLEYSQLDFFQRLKRDITRNKASFVLGIISMIVFTFFGKWDENKIAMLISYPGLLLVLFVMREIRIVYSKQFNYSIPVTYLNVFLVLYLFTTVTIRDTLNDVTAIKHGYRFLGTQVRLDQMLLTSDSTTTYVGQTKNYIFFYNLKTSESYAYPKNKLVSIKLVKK